MAIYELLRFSRCRLGITMGLWERRRDLNAYDTLEQRARSLAPTASPASALEMSVESVSQARSAREDRCYQEVAG